MSVGPNVRNVMQQVISLRPADIVEGAIRTAASAVSELHAKTADANAELRFRGIRQMLTKADWDTVGQSDRDDILEFLDGVTKFANRQAGARSEDESKTARTKLLWQLEALAERSERLFTEAVLSTEAQLLHAQNRISDLEKQTVALSAENRALKEDREKVAAIAVKTGVDNHAKHFEQLCRRNSVQSWSWAAVVGALAAAGVGYIYFSFPHSVGQALPSSTVPELLGHVAPRLLIVTILYAVMIWAARNFSAARHNHTINSHRAAALKSFDAFTSATEGDKELRLAILKQVTTAIFESQATAYLKEPASGNENLIQVFADAVTKKGPDA